MNPILIIFGVAGTGLIFAVAAWLSPKMIRAVFPEEQHESMLKTLRVMIIVALIMVVLAVISVVPILFQGTPT